MIYGRQRKFNILLVFIWYCQILFNDKNMIEAMRGIIYSNDLNVSNYIFKYLFIKKSKMLHPENI